MLIIVEGADKTGKTTLCNEISRKFGYTYHHFGAPGPDPAKEYAEFLINLDKPAVCDRFYYGELVYGPLLRGKSLITKLQQTVLERLCRFQGAWLIHADPPLEIISARLKQLGDPLISKKQNTAAYYAFRDILRNSSLPKFNYNSHEYSAEEFVMINRSMLNVYAKPDNTLTGIGTIEKPEIILVGDSLNKNVTWMGLPFDAGSCSEYLDYCLRSSGIREEEIYIVNSITVTLGELNYLDAAEAKVVALGAKASIKLNSLNIPHVAIPHPQYWKRFHSREQHTYIKMLNKACNGNN